MADLNQFVLDQWERLGIRQAEFARRINAEPARVEQYRTGKRSFPYRLIALWAEKLELSPEKAEEFKRLCYQSGDREALNQWIAELQDANDKLRQQGERRDRQIANLEQLLARITPHPTIRRGSESDSEPQS